MPLVFFFEKILDNSKTSESKELETNAEEVSELGSKRGVAGVFRVIDEDSNTIPQPLGLQSVMQDPSPAAEWKHKSPMVLRMYNLYWYPSLLLSLTIFWQLLVIELNREQRQTSKDTSVFNGYKLFFFSVLMSGCCFSSLCVVQLPKFLACVSLFVLIWCWYFWWLLFIVAWKLIVDQDFAVERICELVCHCDKRTDQL